MRQCEPLDRFTTATASHPRSSAIASLHYFCFSLSNRDVEVMMLTTGTTAVQSAAAATVSDAANEAYARRAEITREQAARSK